mmetsp:Transcript_13590/g.30195  ORF Transcript_13590/g.30195 Transcript_13590/m.30195 type:complete len:343 (+) Transcript_13590:1-1029(+)
MFYITPFFNFISGLNKQNIISGLVPKGEVDNWLGYMDSYDQLLQAVSPFLLIKFLQDEEWGPYPYDTCTPLPAVCSGTVEERFVAGCPCTWSADLGSMDTFAEGTFVLAGAVLTLVSLIPYGMLTKRFPLRKALTVEDIPESEKEALQVYKETGDFTWLTASQFWEVSEENMREGKPPLRNRFGDFESDKKDLDRIMSMARTDSLFWGRQMQEMIKQWRVGGPQKEEMKKMLVMESEAPLWTDIEEDCNDIFDWLKHYMAYAGYSNPCEMPRYWKGIFMTAFPKMPYQYGAKNPKYLEDPVPMLQAGQKFMKGQLKMMDLHSDALGLIGGLRIDTFKVTGMM